MEARGTRSPPRTWQEAVRVLGCVASRYSASKSLGSGEREAFMTPGSFGPDVFLGREVWVGAERVACPVPLGENLQG